MSVIEKKLRSMGIMLPTPPSPIANFVPCVRTGDLIFLSGQGPVFPDGSKMLGKLGTDCDVSRGKDAARLAAINLLAVLKEYLGNLDRVSRIVKVFGMVNAAPDFDAHPMVINGCSDFLVEVFGERGRHARSAIGMSSLPGNIPVEIEMIVEVDQPECTSSEKIFHRLFFERHIPSLQHCTFFNTADQGPRLDIMQKTMLDVYDRIYRETPSAPPVPAWLSEKAEHAREVLAAFFGADREETAFIRSVAEGLNMLLPLMGLERGDEIITSDEENPAFHIPIYHLAREKGLIVRRVPIMPDKESFMDIFRDTIGPRTRLAALSHVTHVSGTCLPVDEIAALGRNRGFRTIIDGAQSAGQIPINFHALGCDAYLCAGYKWMLGQMGTAIMLLRHSLSSTLIPVDLGVGSESSFDVDSCNFTLKPDARRFEYGSRHLPLYIALEAAAEWLSDLGMERICRHNRALASTFCDGLRSIPGIRVLSSPQEDMMSGLTGFVFPGGANSTANMIRLAWERERIVIKSRKLPKGCENPESVRVCLHFFNTYEEIMKMLAFVKDFVRTNSRNS